MASALIRGVDKRSSSSFSGPGSVLSLRDLTVCGDTDGIHAIAVLATTARRRQGRGCGSMKARHTGHMGPESIRSFSHPCAPCFHVPGAADTALDKFQFQPSRGFQARGRERWSQIKKR